MSDCMYEVGDKITFTPTAYKGGIMVGSCGTKERKDREDNSKVKATVTEVNEDRRWYRAELTPDFDRPQHECFKF